MYRIGLPRTNIYELQHVQRSQLECTIVIGKEWGVQFELDGVDAFLPACLSGSLSLWRAAIDLEVGRADTEHPAFVWSVSPETINMG